MILNNEIKYLLKTEFVDYIGYANLKNYQKELVKYGGEIGKDYK